MTVEHPTPDPQAAVARQRRINQIAANIVYGAAYWNLKGTALGRHIDELKALLDEQRREVGRERDGA